MNKLIKYYANISALFLLAILLAACEIIVPKDIKVKEEEVLAKYKDVPLKDVMNDVQKKFQKAKDGEMFFYSPNNYRTARTGLQTARAYYRDPEKKTYVLTSLYRADKALDDSVEVKKIVERELSEHIKLRDFLYIMEAEKSHSREFRSLMTQLISIIERIEKDKEDIFKDPERKKDMEQRKKDMMADLLNFRLRVVKFKYLNHGSLLIAEADNYDAKNIAPETYAQAIAARDSAVKYVTENVENLEGIAAVAKKFEYEAERLLQITRAVETVLKLEKNTHEKYVLRQEEYLQKIGDALREPKLRYDSFPAQAAKYAGAIRRLQKENQDFALEIADLKSAGTIVNTAGTDQQANTESTDATQKKENPESTEIVPVNGDPDQIRNSLRILTDQVYQLTVEKNAWQGERARLKRQIKKLQAAQKVETKAVEKPKPEVKAEDAKAEAKKADVKKESAAKKTETKVKASTEEKTKSEEAASTEQEKTEADKAATDTN